MDRHQLLEQKRQRLAELRQRRLAASGSGNVLVETDLISAKEIGESIEMKPSRIKPLVNVGVQVKPETSGSKSKITVIKEVAKFDKAVQTINRDTVKPQEEEKEEKEEKEETNNDNEIVVEKETNYNENDLNKLLKEAIIFLSEIVAQVTVKSTDDVQFVSSFKNDLIQLVNEYNSNNGVPTIIDVSPQPNEFIISFNDKPDNDFPGLAIIYQLKNDKVVPVNFLGCESSISILKFDHSSNKKVIGGLKNGRVVVWEIDDQNSDESVLLPTLMSPVDYTSSSFHKSAITSILQLPSETNTFISTCEEGLVNVWSVNFVEHPRNDTIIIPNDIEDSDSMGILAKRNKGISRALILGNGDDLLKNSKFLNSMMIGTPSGTIHQLIDDPKLGYINSTINTKIIGSLIDIGYKDDLPIIAATCFDSNIHIYNSHKEILQLFTNYLVLGLFKRPNYHFQFVTYGLYNELADSLSTTIDFWDLNTNIRSPIHSIKVSSSEHPILGQFDIVGDIFYIGFSDGKVSVFKISREKMSTMTTHNDESINDII